MKKFGMLVASFLVAYGAVNVSKVAAVSAGSEQEAKFLVSMSEHHKDGIEMAKMALAKAQSKEVKKLAREISSEQSAELKKMETWQSKWYPQTEIKPERPKMDMSKLEQASGKDFDRSFLDMMTEHHNQAIEMTKSALSGLEHKEAKAMAKKGLKTQTAEVAKMEKLKASL